ncbi:cAMP-dependent protein kinase catalytic subunit [Drosophila gunungcola]|uniref:Uncharacterized protein n=1 Tax=Drosophila gunungcola TaxID=103775 RepID=A0A9P9YCI9_9MUSC|nr:cAMP-dependent protein kinase catalytic subunit [Drosophila gunungcola]KAI8034318.1 hypothetical protein M5D96_012871 [Drosophila gunungcola]
MSSNRIRPELLLLLAATLIPLLQAGIVRDPDTDPDTTIASTDLDLGQSPYTEQLETKSESQKEPSVQVDGRRIDCKLTFDAATMDSLGCHNEEAWHRAGNKPVEKPLQNPDWQQQQQQQQQQQKQQHRHLKSPDSQPIYELQLVVWPTDIEDGDDFGPPLTTTTTTTTDGTTTSSSSSSTTTPKPTQVGTPIEQIWPLYEDQLVVFPQMDFEEENLDYFFDEVAPPTSASTTRPATTSHPTGTPTPTPIYVVQNYHVIHPNGTEEYKLVMSNGLVNYKKLYTKKVGDQVINVQEGYNSVPIPGPKNQIQTQYYIADERGYNVYRIELHYHQPGLPKHLHYKATKATNM